MHEKERPFSTVRLFHLFTPAVKNSSLPLKHIQICERSERTHALRVCLDDLLVIKEHPPTLRPYMRDIMARVYRGPFMRYERAQAVSRR